MAECTCELILTIEEPDAIELSYVEAEIKPEQTKDVVPAETAQTVEPDPGFTLSAVNVAAIPDEYIIPSGKIKFYENTIGADISQYAEADIAVTPSLQQKTVTPTEAQQTVDADSGYDGLSAVMVERIPQEYYNTSEANVNPSDITLGKIGYSANGEVIGTNDYVKPSKGVIFTDWDGNGFPHTMSFKNMSVIPRQYLQADGYNHWGVSAQVENIIFESPVQSFEYASIQGTKVKILTIPRLPDNGYVFIGESAFSNSYSIETIIFDAKVRFDTAPFLRAQNVTTVIAKQSPFAWSNIFNPNNDAGGRKISLYDFSECESIFALNNATYLPHVNGCVIRIPSALSDTTLGVGNGWESATNWCDLTGVVWEVV